MKKILVIEDEPDILENITELLEAEGYDVLTAPNGKVAVEFALRLGPDLIISDMMMPEMDGNEVLKIVRSNPQTRLVPFIFLTARADQADVRMGMNDGADDYISKPFKVNDLLCAVHSRFEKAEAMQQSIEEQMNALRRNITTAIPHELRTPLSGIIGFTQILIDDWKDMDPHDVDSILNEIFGASQRIKSLTERFSLVAELETILSHKVKMASYRNKVQQSTEMVMRQVTSSMASRYHRPQDLHLEIQDAPLAIDAKHFRRLFREVVDNAFKFSESGTPVTIRSWCSDQNFELEVGQLGRGLAENQIKSIGAFVQFDRDLYEQQGSGLGLCMVKQIVTLYQGAFEIESSDKGETIVRITLPLAPSSELIAA